MALFTVLLASSLAAEPPHEVCRLIACAVLCESFTCSELDGLGCACSSCCASAPTGSPSSASSTPIEKALRVHVQHIQQLEEENRLLKDEHHKRPPRCDPLAPVTTNARRMSEASQPPSPPASPIPPSPPSPPSVPVACPCIDVYPPGTTADSTALNVSIFGELYAYPPTYGLGCGAHDAGTRPYCATTLGGTLSPLDNPRWCSDLWCYVDPSDCNVDSANYTVGASYQTGVVLSYSFAT